MNPGTWAVAQLAFVRGRHRETRTRAASRRGTLGPRLCRHDLSAVQRFGAFELASRKEKRNRSDVFKLVYRAWPLSAAGCQKAVLPPLPDCLRRVPGLGPCFGNGHPNGAGMAARRLSEFCGCCPLLCHRGNFADTLARKTTAERDRYPVKLVGSQYPAVRQSSHCGLRSPDRWWSQLECPTSLTQLFG